MVPPKSVTHSLLKKIHKGVGVPPFTNKIRKVVFDGLPYFFNIFLTWGRRTWTAFPKYPVFFFPLWRGHFACATYAHCGKYGHHLKQCNSSSQCDHLLGQDSLTGPKGTGATHYPWLYFDNWSSVRGFSKCALHSYDEMNSSTKQKIVRNWLHTKNVHFKTGPTYSFLIASFLDAVANSHTDYDTLSNK